MKSQGKIDDRRQRVDDSVPIAVSAILPAYNEEAGIAAALNQLQTVLENANYLYEIIVVNDGSIDRTSEILQQILPQQQFLQVIEHRQNRGYGAALKTGIRHAQYPLLVMTDADGTYPNDRIPDLVEKAASADMVVGARVGESVTYSTIRRIPKWFLVRFGQWITKTEIPDLNSGLRVIDKQIAERFLSVLPDTFSFTTTITIAFLTNHYIVYYVPINYYKRLGKSKIKPIRDTLRFVQLILRTGVYFAPLRIFLPIALVFFIGFLITLSQDIFIRRDLTERTLILLVTSTQISLFALLADMIDKRSKPF